MNTLADDLDYVANITASKYLKHELRTLAHKLRFPMKDIIAKIPGGNIREKAKAVRVSFQTVYTWRDERFRPVLATAIKISKLTGVPITDIMEYPNDTGRTVATKAPKLARSRKATSRVHGRAGRVVARSKRAKRVAGSQT